MQIMAAERDFLETKYKRAQARQQELISHIQVLRRQLLSAGLKPEVAAARLATPNDSADAPDALLDSDEEAERCVFLDCKLPS